MAVKVNTAAMRNASQKIRAINSGMRSETDTVNEAVRNLFRNWDSMASDSARRNINNIIKSYGDNRSTVIDNMARFLSETAGAAYETTETALDRMSRKFK